MLITIGFIIRGINIIIWVIMILNLKENYLSKIKLSPG